MQELILVKCHYIKPCHDEGAYIIEYGSDPETPSVYYGSCEIHIEEMRKGVYGMAYRGDIKVTPKFPELDIGTNVPVQVTEIEVKIGKTREPEAAE